MKIQIFLISLSDTPVMLEGNVESVDSTTKENLDNILNNLSRLDIAAIKIKLCNNDNKDTPIIQKTLKTTFVFR